MHLQTAAQQVVHCLHSSLSLSNNFPLPLSLTCALFLTRLQTFLLCPEHVVSIAAPVKEAQAAGGRAGVVVEVMAEEEGVGTVGGGRRLGTSWWSSDDW